MNYHCEIEDGACDGTPMCQCECEQCMEAKEVDIEAVDDEDTVV